MREAYVHDQQYLKDVQWEYCDSMILGNKSYQYASIKFDLFLKLPTSQLMFRTC